MENKKSSRKWLVVVIVLLFLVGIAVGCVLLFGGDRNNDSTLGNTTGTSQSGVSEPGVSEPDVTEPDVSQPDVTVPDVSEPDPSVPHASEPDPSVPEVSEPAPSEPDASQPGDVEQGPEDDDPDAQKCAHTYGQWVIVSEADCVTAGTKARTCSKCSDTEKYTVPAIGHSYGSWKTTKAATCELSGTKESTCANCGHVKTDVVPATGHAWDEGKDVVVSTNCSDVGSRRYTCTKCNKKRLEQIKGTHTFGDWQYEDAIIESGDYKGLPTSKKYHVCSKCNYKEYGNVPEHYCKRARAANDRYTIEGTCTKPNIQVVTCPDCGREWRFELGYGPHSWKSETRHLTDYTEYTNELDVEISTCTACGKKSCSYIEGKGFAEVNRSDASIKFGIGGGDKYPGEPNVNQWELIENPTWQCAMRDPVYDANGYLIQFTYNWHDKKGNRYSNIIVIADIPEMFSNYNISDADINRVQFDIMPIVLGGGQSTIVADRISWSG